MSRPLRAGTTADLEGVVALFLACWRQSYAPHLPAALVASMTDEAASALWDRVLGDASREIVVAEAAGAVCGVVGYTADGEIGWVHSLYVAPTEQGHGTGALLLRYAARALHRAGARDGRLWVFAGNIPAVAFYRRQGWHPDGETRVEEQFGEPEVRLARPLEPAVMEVAP